MKKREIIEQVNNANAWEKDGLLLDLLEGDGRLEKHNRINTYWLNIQDGVRFCYYSGQQVVVVYRNEETQDIIDFKVLCQDSKLNHNTNKR